jgi:putative membrane protein
MKTQRIASENDAAAAEGVVPVISATRNSAPRRLLKGLNAVSGVPMMLRLLTTTAVVAVGLLAAPPIFAQTGQPGHAAATSAKDALDQEDKTFVREAAIGGMAEVELSKIAQKSENGDVKRFADRMIADHTEANEQLTTIATGLGVDLPKTLDSQHERIRQELQTLHGKAFDDQYVHDMVEDHNKAVKLFQQEERSGHNTELKQFAQKTLPTLEEHQKMALELSHKLSQTAAR